MRLDRDILRDSLSAVQDIMNAMANNYNKSTYNFDAGVKRLQEAINELLINCELVIKTLHNNDYYKPLSNMMEMVNMQLPQLMNLDTREAILRTLHRTITSTNAPDVIMYNFDMPIREFLEDDDDFADYHMDYSAEFNNIIDLGVGIVRDLINQDKPANILFPHYHRMSSRFLSTYWPTMIQNSSKENNNLYISTTHASDIGYKERDNFAGVAVGDFDTFMATNNAFDLIFDMPNYLTYGTTHGVSYPIFLLRRYWNYLKEKGVLVLGIPSFIMTREIRLYLHNHFVIKGLRMYTTNHAAFPEPIIYYYLVLQKEFKMNIEESAANLQYQILTDLALHKTADIRFDQPLPGLNYTTLSNIRLFKGSKPDTALLMSILVNSPLYNRTQEQKQEVLKPLLPFERGQIGLVLASGRLDGIIDEGNGYKHVIRGRVFKSSVHKKDIVEEHENSRDGKIEITNTINNLTEINVMTGNGIYKNIVVPVAM